MQFRNVTSPDKIDDRTILCKALISIKTYFGDTPKPRQAILYIITRTVRLRKPSYGDKKFTSEPPTGEQSMQIFNLMISRGYIEFSHYYKPKPGESLRAAVGEKMYRIGQLKYTECTETSWYKNRARKERFVHQQEKIDRKSCKALNQIYAMFGQTPFSYKLVITAANTIINLSVHDDKYKREVIIGNDKIVELTPAEKIALKHMKSKLYTYDESGFKQIWQSLIRNGYIVNHKIKTMDGYIKNTGLYKINYPRLRTCLAEMI